jgi:hypothetical protein
MSYKSNNATFASKSGVKEGAAGSNPADSLTSGEVTALQAIAAETPNLAITSGSGSFSTSNSSFTDVTNLSSSFAVGSSDSYVEIGLIPDNTDGNSYIGAQTTSPDDDVAFYIRILRDGTEISQDYIRNRYQGNATGVIRIPCGSLKFIEQPGAGTYTYKIQVARVSSNTLVVIHHAKLYIKEIRR